MAPIVRWVDGTQLCAQTDPEMWFADDLPTMEKAIAICHHCPLLEPCREYGIEHQVQGIWGGTIEAARKAIRRQRGIVGIQVKLTDFK